MKHLAVIALLLVVVAPGLPAAVDAPRPNIVVILVDDMGFSDLGCYGGEIETPNLDALAAGGLRFTHFYNTAKCSQTRATLLTGRYYPEVGMRDLRDCITIAEGLRLGGYSTLMTGKWHLSGNPLDRGWDRYFGHLSGSTNFFTGDETFRLDRKRFHVPPSGFYTTDANTDYAMRFLDDSTEPGKPFFLYMAYNAPHFPLQAPRRDVEKYLGKYRKGWDVLRQERYRRMIDRGLIDRKWALSPRPDDVPAWESIDPDSRRQHDLLMATYAAMIDRVDQNIGRLVAKFKKMGVFENTLILLLSDNGACPFQRTRPSSRQESLRPWDPRSYWTYHRGWALACNTPFRLYKRNQHEGGISTPLIAHWPRGLRRGGTITHQVGHLVDILPTCLELAGVDYPERHRGHAVGSVRGRSLVPVFEGKQRRPHEELYFLFGDRTHMALRQGDWKIVARDGGPWELYDIRADRTELNDLAPKETARLKAMTRRWEELHEQIAGREKAPPR